MSKPPSICLLGDYNETVKAHLAIPKALELAQASTGVSLTFTWCKTDSLSKDVKDSLLGYSALWLVPNSPYANMPGVLDALSYGRLNSLPTFGTCGGFQHMLIEYARNVLDVQSADHTESDPNTPFPLVSRLSCSLVGQHGKISLSENSQVRKYYGSKQIVEGYHCNFGLNPTYRDLFNKSELQFIGTDENGEARVLEHLTHPFYIGTLFQPELSAFTNEPHPLICAFVRQAAQKT